MNVSATTLFLALLAVLAEGGVVAAVALNAGAGRSPQVARARAAFVAAIAPHGLALALAVATVAMAGSLYFSEVAHYVPCKLCWYQRICMYPLVPMLALAVRRRDVSVRPYAALLAGIGAVVSSYHIVLERFPDLESSVCDPANPCTLIWVRRFGYLTIPTMALSGFLLILTLLAVVPVSTARPQPDALDAVRPD